jgi:hypothetical protein
MIMILDHYRYSVKPPDFVVDNVPVILPAPEKDWPR